MGELDIKCMRRKVTIADESNCAIEIWLKFHLSRFDEIENAIVAIINCATRGPSDLRRVETTHSSRLQRNPDIAETLRLRTWFDSTGCKIVESFKRSNVVNETEILVRPIEK